jgi:hypothetical protein
MRCTVGEMARTQAPGGLAAAAQLKASDSEPSRGDNDTSKWVLVSLPAAASSLSNSSHCCPAWPGY